MKIQMNMTMMATACIVVGIVGALSSVGKPQAATANGVQQGKGEGSSDLCAVAASFEGDAAGRAFAKTLRDAVGCAHGSARS